MWLARWPSWLHCSPWAWRAAGREGAGPRGRARIKGRPGEAGVMPKREDHANSPVNCREYSSPACMLHELDSNLGGQVSSPAPPLAMCETEEWEEVRLWRKVKRAVLIERRLAMADAERGARSAAITAVLKRHLLAFPGRTIGFYWPWKGEYDPRPLARSLHAVGTRLALPVAVRENEPPLIFRLWTPGASMACDARRIPGPSKGGPVALDILLVPLLGFDDQGHRLGNGGGFYDRTLAMFSIRPRIIGVDFEQARLRTIHPQPHDIPTDIVVTESRGR